MVACGAIAAKMLTRRVVRFGMDMASSTPMALIATPLMMRARIERGKTDDIDGKLTPRKKC